MKKVWRTFWKVLETLLNTVNFVAQAGEKYAETINDSADVDRQKAKAKLAKAKRKLDQAEA